ncbi:DUF433 domain-containing protein [Myxococcota bacterium]|nr:DUF433 domain-containing protein [Myxococcota bacterium]MCZ7618691.1 DUF433 domain-containing protein [Myxococcota bacterium]
MTRFRRITSDPERLNGQPCIRNLRRTVRRVLEALATHPDRDALRREYPELEDEEIRQALGDAAAALEDRLLDLPRSARGSCPIFRWRSARPQTRHRDHGLS